MLALDALVWGVKRISRELDCSRNTVRVYLRRGGWRARDVSARASALEPHRQWLAERLRRHLGNADVVRQDLARELGNAVSLHSVQRAVARYAASCVPKRRPPCATRPRPVTSCRPSSAALA